MKKENVENNTIMEMVYDLQKRVEELETKGLSDVQNVSVTNIFNNLEEEHVVVNNTVSE